jgi:four helix bundle protein
MDISSDQSPLPHVSTFRDLLAWQASKQLALEVLRTCEKAEMRRYYGLCDQLRRAAISVPSNIAEGNERGTNLDALRFLQIARGSLAELETQLELSRDFGSLPAADYDRMAPQVVRVGRLLGGLIKARQARQTK